LPDGDHALFHNIDSHSGAKPFSIQKKNTTIGIFD